MKTVYFAGGCFWCITPIFKMYDGVFEVVSGYSGGDEENPSYELVKSQKTLHRETVAVSYDENLISYNELLKIFLGTVDVTDAEGQYIDRGRSYTLAVYYLDEAEKASAEEEIRKFEQENDLKCEISVEKFKSFYKAEEYHQDYYLKNPEEFEKELETSGRKER